MKNRHVAQPLAGALNSFNRFAHAAAALRVVIERNLPPSRGLPGSPDDDLAERAAYAMDRELREAREALSDPSTVDAVICSLSAEDYDCAMVAIAAIAAHPWASSSQREAIDHLLDILAAQAAVDRAKAQARDGAAPLDENVVELKK
jgi:hypothetical protein